MDNPSSESARPGKTGWLFHMLAGLQAGIVGVLWMFGCFLVAAFWTGLSIWSVPNLFSTVFYGDYAYQGEFLRSTWAGIALIVVIYGILGVVWGGVCREHRAPFLTLVGSLTGLGVYYFFFEFVWAHADPLIPLYAPVGQLQLAHILWGAALARSPRYSMRIAAAMRPPVASHAGDQEPAEIVSGELIL